MADSDSYKPAAQAGARRALTAAGSCEWGARWRPVWRAADVSLTVAEFMLIVVGAAAVGFLVGLLRAAHCSALLRVWSWVTCDDLAAHKERADKRLHRTDA